MKRNTSKKLILMIFSKIADLAQNEAELKKKTNLVFILDKKMALENFLWEFGEKEEWIKEPVNFIFTRLFCVFFFFSNFL